MEGQAERTEVVDVVELRYQLVEAPQQKYRCRCDGVVETAPGPERAVEGGRYSLRFGVKVAVDKYLFHVPLARKQRMMRDSGLQVTRQTLWDQLWAVQDGPARARRSPGQGGAPQPPSRAAGHRRRPVPGARFRALQWVGTSEPVDWPSLHERSAKKWQIWALSAPGVIHHRAKATDEAHLADLRHVETDDVLERMRSWMASIRVPSSTSLGEAITQTQTHWRWLKRIRDNSALWLDNNLTERALRGPVEGRRNHFGPKSRRGTEAAAILYSLVETAKLQGVNPSDDLYELCRRRKLCASQPYLPWPFAADVAERADGPQPP